MIYNRVLRTRTTKNQYATYCCSHYSFLKSISTSIIGSPSINAVTLDNFVTILLRDKHNPLEAYLLLSFREKAILESWRYLFHLMVMVDEMLIIRREFVTGLFLLAL